MKKIWVLLGIVVFYATVVLGGEKEPYNFVVIMADDLGWADVSPNKPDTFYETPNLQKFVDGGAINFKQGYSPNPVCSPARYGFQTGKYPVRGGLTNWLPGAAKKSRFSDAPNAKGMSLDEITIAEKMKEKGYTTYIGGKWHLKEYPLQQGYDVAIGVNGMGVNKLPRKKYFAPFNEPRFAHAKAGDYYPDYLGEATVNFIKENKDKKLFVLHSFNLVHTPLFTKESLVNKYKEKASKMGINPEGEYEEVENGGGTKRRVMSKQSNPTFAGMMEAMDTITGNILRTIEECGIADKTVVIFLSDNGASIGRSSCNKPLRDGKATTYEGGIRIPFFVKVPGFSNDIGECSETPVCLIDIYPTICELAGIEISHKIDGVSLVPLLKGDKSYKHPDIYCHYPHYANDTWKPSGVIRSGDWKLIQNYEDGSFELYNLKNDIGETKDLAKENPEKVAEMKKKLYAWYKDTGAKFLQGRYKETSREKILARKKGKVLVPIEEPWKPDLDASI